MGWSHKLLKRLLRGAGNFQSSCFGYSTIMASTGHSSAACWVVSSNSGGTSLAVTSAISVPIWKTSGQISTQNPQAVQVSSIRTFMINPFLTNCLPVVYYYSKICQIKIFLWKIFFLLLYCCMLVRVGEYRIDNFRPGPMQTESVNLVRRGTEQP